MSAACIYAKAADIFVSLSTFIVEVNALIVEASAPTSAQDIRFRAIKVHLLWSSL